VGELLLRRGWRLSVAESCTGGLLGSAVTSVPGSSGWFEGGVVSYSDRVKARVLGVPAGVLEEHGAVSRETVKAMCGGVSALLGTEAAIAVSGIAGPGGGTEEKPVGTVWIAVLAGSGSDCRMYRFPGDRNAVREASVAHSLGMLFGLLRGERD
jgi:PncC family amidohydrolase